MKLIIKNLFFLSSVTVLTGILNYFFQFFIAKYLNLLDYKIFNLSMSFSTFFGIPVTILTLLITKESSQLFQKKNFFQIYYLYKKTLIYITYFIGLSFVISILFLDFFILTLEIYDLSLLFKLFLLHSFGLYFPVILIFIYALRNYFIYNLLLVISSLKKVLIAFSLLFIVSLNFSNLITSIMYTTIIIVLIAHIVFIKKIKEFNFSSNHKKNFFNIINKKKEIFRMALITFFNSSIVSLDIIIVSYFYSVEITSNYILASMFGKIIFYISSTFNILVINEAHGLFVKKIKTTDYIIVGVITNILVSISLGFFFYFFSAYLINYLYDTKYIFSPDILKIITFMIFPFSLMLTIEHYLFSINEIYFSKIYFFVLLLILAALIFFNLSIFTFIILSGIMGYLCLISFFVFKYKKLNFS